MANKGKYTSKCSKCSWTSRVGYSTLYDSLHSAPLRAHMKREHRGKPLPSPSEKQRTSDKYKGQKKMNWDKVKGWL